MFFWDYPIERSKCQNNGSNGTQTALLTDVAIFRYCLAIILLLIRLN